MQKPRELTAQNLNTAADVRVIDAAKTLVMPNDPLTDVKTIKAVERARSVSSAEVNIEWFLSGRNEANAALLDIFLFSYKNDQTSVHNREKFKAAIECLLNYLEADASIGGASADVKIDVLTRLCASNNLLMNMIKCYPDGVERLCKIIRQHDETVIAEIFTQQDAEGKNALHLALVSSPDKLDALLGLLENLDGETIFKIFKQVAIRGRDYYSTPYGGESVLQAALADLNSFEKLTALLKTKLSSSQLSEIYAHTEFFQGQKSTLLSELLKKTTGEEAKIEAIINDIADRLVTDVAYNACITDALTHDSSAPYMRYKTLLDKLTHSVFKENERADVYSTQLYWSLTDRHHSSGLALQKQRVPLCLYRSMQLPVKEQARVFKHLCSRNDSECLDMFKDRHVRGKPLSALCFYTIQLASIAQEFKDLSEKTKNTNKQTNYNAIYSTLNMVHQEIAETLSNAGVTDKPFDTQALKQKIQAAILTARDASKEHRKPLLDFLYNLVKVLTVVGALHMSYRFIANCYSGYGAHFHKTHRATELEKLHAEVAKFDGSDINEMINKEAGYTPANTEVVNLNGNKV